MKELVIGRREKVRMSRRDEVDRAGYLLYSDVSLHHTIWECSQ
jgi:hypothetical protein